MSISWFRLLPTVNHQPQGSRATRLSRPGVESLEPRCLLDAGLVRSIDGTGNNLLHPEWAAPWSSCSGWRPPSTPTVPSAPPGPTALPPARSATSWPPTSPPTRPTARPPRTCYIWGQFLDHDLDLTGSASPAESFNIPVLTGDPSFDPNGTGTQVIPLSRSLYDPATGTVAANLGGSASTRSRPGSTAR
ncbi:MAG: peroxidase family protein [Gemmataceae bacterium]